MGPRWSLRRARWLFGTKFMLIAGLVGFIGLAWLIETVIGLRGPVALGPLAAGAMSAIPAVLWLGFFYLLDRHEPEPKHFVIGVCVLGALIAAPLADFVVQQTVPPIGLAQSGLSPFSLDNMIYAVFVIGLAQEVCKYAAVRYTVYMSQEFDEPMDGVVYMMAAGTGFAVWINYHRLSSQGHEVFLLHGAAQAVITTLAHASFAGVLGYVMGRAKFSRRRPAVRGLLIMVGLLLAAALNGQFAQVEVWLNREGMQTNPWRALGYAAALAAVIFASLMFLARRLLHDSQVKTPGAP